MISVIIPTYNRCSIISCLSSIVNRQIDAPSFEVIVVARDLKDPLRKEIHNKFPIVRVLDFNYPGNGPAKNYGVKSAKGDCIVFTDDDCIPHKDWLYQLNNTQQVFDADIVSGPAYAFDAFNPYLVAHQGALLYHMRKFAYDGPYGPSITKIGTTMNLLIKKEVFERLNGFSPYFSNHYGDDYEFNYRWANNQSIKAYENSSAIIYHDHKLTFKKLMKLSFRYGMGLEHCKKLIQTYRGDVPNVHTLRREYLAMNDFIAYQSHELYDTPFDIRFKAGKLAILAHEFKRLGSMYSRLFPTAPSKIYD